jgi:hypothetical protein
MTGAALGPADAVAWRTMRASCTGRGAGSSPPFRTGALNRARLPCSADSALRRRRLDHQYNVVAEYSRSLQNSAALILLPRHASTRAAHSVSFVILVRLSPTSPTRYTLP